MPAVVTRRAPTAAVVIDGVQIEFSVHAHDRYRERVKDNLDPVRADAELLQMLPFSELVAVDDAPAWLADAAAHERRSGAETAGYLLLADAAFPLVDRGDGTLTTTVCLARGGLGEVARRARSARRARRRGAPRFAHRGRSAARPYSRRRVTELVELD